MRMMKNLLMAGLVLLGGVVRGQDGSLDQSFNPSDLGNWIGDGMEENTGTNAICVEPDGRILIGGYFTSYNGRPHNNIARLEADGTLGTPFGFVGSGPDGYVGQIIRQPNSDLVITGGFNNINGTQRTTIARLTTDGLLDPYFDPGSAANGAISAMALQPDGMFIIGGDFTSYLGISRNRIARLNGGSGLDQTFDPGTGPDGPVNEVLLQPDGKIIITGSFQSYNGAIRRRIARLNPDGTLDTSFNGGTGPNANSTIHSLLLQPDGKIIIVGSFTSYNSTPANRIARLNSDGSLDATFITGTGFNAAVFNTVLQPDGKVIISGSFTSFNGTSRYQLARLNSDGSLDAGFNPGTVSNGGVGPIALVSGGKILIGGNFDSFDGTLPGDLKRLNADGSTDASFNPGSGANRGAVRASALQPDGKIIIAGTFWSFNGIPRYGIARLHSDGSPDMGFDTGTGTWMNSFSPIAAIYAVAVQPDGKVLIGGMFTEFNGVQRNRVARLNSDGSLDTSFDPGAGANGTVSGMALQPDGKVLICGGFTSYNGTSRNRIARLNADGSLDATFNPGMGSNGNIHAIALQPDGKIVIGGYFSSYNGSGRNNLARLNADGTIDTFVNNGTGGGAGVDIWSIAVQPDGKIIIGGDFVGFGATARNRLVRLNSNGTLDLGFVQTMSQAGASGRVNCITLQPDGKVIIGGAFTQFSGAPRNGLARLNTNGWVDTTFDPGTGLGGYYYDPFSVYCSAVQPDGRIVIGGDFTSFTAIGRNRVTRLKAREGIRVMLEGPYTNGLMNDALRTLPSFPLTEPFSAMGYANAAYTAGASIPASVLAATGNNAIVDWVLVEMRPASAPGTITAARAALLQRDGDVVALDGTGLVTFPGLANGSYCLALRPRNHLPVMLATTAPVNYTGTPPTVDFTLVGTQVYDADARKNVSGVMVLAAGDVTFNGTVSYVGSGNDRDPILLRVGGGTPTNTASGYWREDTNLDGVVKYIGAANDRDIILQSIGGIVPSNTRVAGLP